MLDICIQLPPYEVELHADIDHQLSVLLSKMEIEPVVPAVMFDQEFVNLFFHNMFVNGFDINKVK
jgi:hypothetical protein